MTNKQELRKNIAIIKKSASAENLKLYSKIIQQRLEETDAFRHAKCIALYYALNDEVQTIDLIEKWYEKKKIAIPAVSGNDINFYQYKGSNSIATGHFGISEPTSTERISLKDIDLIVVPGVAFDKKKNRMGRGKGYYDRFIAQTNAPTIGICFGFQLLEEIPTELHDRKMTMIITENAIVS